MICPFCSFRHDHEGDLYGCPNCLGEGLAYDDDPEGPEAGAPPDLTRRYDKSTTFVL